jgi:single-strand DNA-binding protein
MADLKMPEINSVIIVGNLTKDPIFRQTTSGIPVVNFSIACDRKHRDVNSQWQEEVCYVGVVAWNRLADSCISCLKKGSAVLIDGELQSHSFKSDDGFNRNVVEIKARRIQFLNKKGSPVETSSSDEHHYQQEDELSNVEDTSFERFLTSEESQILKDQSSIHSQRP